MNFIKVRTKMSKTVFSSYILFNIRRALVIGACCTSVLIPLMNVKNSSYIPNNFVANISEQIAS